jgi:hypothetical protein
MLSISNPPKLVCRTEPRGIFISENARHFAGLYRCAIKEVTSAMAATDARMKLWPAGRDCLKTLG